MTTWCPVLHPKPPTRNPVGSGIPKFNFTSLKPAPTGPGEISIHLEAFPKPKLFWFRDRMAIKEKSDRLKSLCMEVGPNKYLAQLQIDSFSNCDAGMYSCMAQNSYGSARFDVRVSGEEDSSKPIVLKAPHIHYLGNCTFRFTVSVWSPKKQKIFWRKFKRGKEVQLDTSARRLDGSEPRIAISAREVRKHVYDIAMDIHEASRIDKGVYRCEVVDAGGELKCEFPLVCEKGAPEGRPELVAEPKIIQLKSQSIAMAFCVKSHTEPQFAWVFPDGEVVLSEKIKNSNVEFTWKRLKHEGPEPYYHGKLLLNHWFSVPKGNYTCLARNAVGCLEIKFNLSVSEDLMAPSPSWC